MAMTATVKGKQLIITIDMQKAAPSASGKTMIVATSGGNQVIADCLVDGKPVTIGLNAYYKP